jgi:hypothetical protein
VAVEDRRGRSHCADVQDEVGLAVDDGRSAIKWGIVTLGLCLASLAIPLPFVRILLAGVVAFIALMVAKAHGGR